MNNEQGIWSENESEVYRTISRYAVPERERQIDIVLTLVKSARGGDVADLCCGEGLLANSVLDAFTDIGVVALDGSESMLEQTRRGSRHPDRLRTLRIDLTATDWRALTGLRAVVSSLAIHHLDETGKAALFADIYRMLAPGGVFVLADVILPASKAGNAVAGKMWDEEVLRRSRELTGHDEGLDLFRKADWNHFLHGDIDPMDKPSSVAAHFDMLRAAGFADVDIHWMMAGQAVMSGWKR
jgi:tRNA (cmo5U34)-methyltransferase